MIEKTYPKLKETVLTTKLPNGLTVVMVPKPNYHKTFAVLTTPFGSLARQFQINDETPITIPAGTAHFLEHKLFEKADGDAFTRFGELGADANAFTNPYQTSYLFSTTQNLLPALAHLLDFVQTPYFSAQTVAKEQGIIGQEIQMYDDDANWAIYMGLLDLLYPGAPIAEDIAGTRASIAQITPALLYQIHRAFYQPNQLTLQVVGRFDPDEVLALVAANQATKAIEAVDVRRFEPVVPEPIKKENSQKFDVSRPKIALGIRLSNLDVTGSAATKLTLAADILADILFGEQTDWYQNLYNKGIIDTEFETSFDLMHAYQFVSFFAETTEYEALTTAIQSQIGQYKTILAHAEPAFESLRRATLGEGIQRLNALESIALRGDDVLFGTNLFDKVMLLQDLTYSDILDSAEKIYQNATLRRFVLKK